MTWSFDRDPGEPHLQQLLVILSRRRRWIFAAAGAGVAVALLGILAVSPRYSAKTQIEFEPQAVEQEALSAADQEAVFATHLTALTSRPFLKQVLDNLSRDPAFERGSEAGSHWIGGMLRGLRNSAAGLLALIRGSRTSPARSAELRLDQFASSVNVYQERNSHVIAVTFTSADPDAAALAANRIAQLYIEDVANRRRTEARRTIAWINERIPALRAGFERAEIGREETAAERIYQNLLQRREQLRAEQEMAVSDLRIMSLASPPDRPSSLSPLLFFFPSVIVFCIGGCFLAIAVDRLDRGLHSARDVNDALGVPCIGLVPVIHDRGRARPHEYLLENPFSAYTEAIRSAVATLQLAAAGNAPKVILISSSLPSEGKTTLAVSFAVYCAIIGRRTLLIDLDLRNPTVSRELGMQVETGGLDVLRLGERPAAGAVQHVAGLDIDYLPVRSRPGEPLLPFVGGHVPRLLHELRDSYDCIFIDGPPLLAVAETRLLATMADNVLLAVKWDSTRRDVAGATANLLREFSPADSDGRPVAAVLTQVDLERHTLYRYGGWESVRAVTAPPPAAAALPLPDAAPVEHRSERSGPTASGDARLDAGPLRPGRTPIAAAGIESAEHRAEKNSPLPLLLAILGEFHQQNLSYCYWKSGGRLEAVLCGHSDLDLLIAGQDQHRAEAILLERGFKLFPDVANRLNPAMSSYIGFDEPSGRLVHLHLHFRLVVGEPLLKNYWLPWEAALLDRAVLHPAYPVRVLDPASEAFLLVVRAALERSRLDPIALRHWSATKRKYERDRENLAARLGSAALRRRAGEVFPDDLADMVADAVLLARPLTRRRRLDRRIRRELAAHRAYNAIEARLRSLTRAILWAIGNFNKRVLHLPRPWSRRAPGGGRVVAVIGVDGSGKSTVVAAIRNWLGAEVDVMPAYFGTGDGRPSLLLLPFKMMVPVITRLLRTKPRGATHGRISDRAPGPLYSLLMTVWATAVAAEKRIKLRAAHRAASRGLVVIADRYPQDENPEYSDGPLLPRLKRVPRWLRRFEARSYALASRLPPDLVIELEVTAKTAARREPEMHSAAVRRRIKALRRLAFRGARLVHVNAEQTFAEEIREIKREIWTVL